VEIKNPFRTASLRAAVVWALIAGAIAVAIYCLTYVLGINP
jgi:hypothetical protein